MRRLFGWLAGLVGIAALARHLARRERATDAPAPAVPDPAAPDPAAELRRKLSQTRVDTPPPQAPEARAEPAAPETPRDSLEDRRARVHAKAREAMDEMREP